MTKECFKTCICNVNNKCVIPKTKEFKNFTCSLLKEIKQLETNQIFDILNTLKHHIGLAVADFTNNQVIRDKAIYNMEVSFSNIQDTLDSYFTYKKVLNE